MDAVNDVGEPSPHPISASQKRIPALITASDRLIETLRPRGLIHQQAGHINLIRRRQGQTSQYNTIARC